MTFKYRYKKQIIAGSITVFILLLLGGFIIHQSLEKKDKTKEKTTLMVAKKKSSNPSSLEVEDDFKEIYVDIKGEINLPGTYLIKENNRVKDVIEMAGGLTEYADTSVINLSKKLQDEMVIIVYSKKEVQNFKQTKEKENNALEACKYSEDYGLENDACIENKSNTNNENSKTTAIINLNSATKEELMTLTGIGEAKADDIINYRNTNGGFKNIEDIKNVKGIGDAVFAKIKDHITI